MSDDEGYAPAAQMLICFIFPASVQENTDSDDRSRLLADKTLEVDFFKGALQKIEARRQRNSGSGEMASTTRSGK